MKSLALTVLISVSVALSNSAFAVPLDDPLHCDRPAHDFIGALEEKGLIVRHPSRVEANSINAFDPAHGVDLTAFGYRVFAIVGFQKGDPMFRNGDGTPLADSAYGAVVLGSTDGVKSAVRSAGSLAIVHHVAPFVTAIFCEMDKNAPADRP
jgi:hypothetical protein